VMTDDNARGAIPPERIVDTLFKRGMYTPMTKVMKLATPETQEMVRRLAMDEILGNTTRSTDDVFKTVFDGKKFNDTLKSYGKGTLVAVFGKKRVNELHRLGRVISMVTKRSKLSGGIVAANIALHPWANLGKIVQLHLLQKLMNTKMGVHYLTEGFKAPAARKTGEIFSKLLVQSQMILEEHMRNIKGKEPPPPQPQMAPPPQQPMSAGPSPLG